ncbi:MAG: PAS domain-containing protein [Coriobacteriia bacterium]|nr:PAS domain-containing protein [Coriobacteriia bacterium]
MKDPTTTADTVADFCYAGAWVTPVPALVIDHQSVVYANAAALRLLGYADAHDLVGQPLDRVLHADALVAEMARQEVLDAIGAPLRGVPTKLRSRTGEPLQEFADVFPLHVRDARLTLFTFARERCPDRTCKPGPAPDLSPHAHEIAGQILEVAPTCMLIQDLDTILFANALTRGYLAANERSQIEGRPVLSFIHPDGVMATIERVAFVFATHQQMRDVPLKLKAVDGGVVHARGDAYPIRVNGRWGALIVGELLRRTDDESERR